MPWLSTACPVCANVLPKQSSAVSICGYCLNNKFCYKKTIALFHYKKPASYLIRHLKFNQKLTHAHLLGFLLAEKLKVEYGSEFPDILIPIPLHKKRLKQRGYNQALELARIVHHQLSIPLIKKGLVRQRYTEAQSKVLARDRHKNVRNAFVSHTDVKGKTVLLVDDVITTGFTANEAGKALLKAGAASVHICCLGRTSM
jgi:ComF family protein